MDKIDECEHCIKWMKWIEAWVHIILYCENCYPKVSFEHQRVHGFMVPKNTHPDVIEYVRDICESLQESLCSGEIEHLIVAINPNQVSKERRYWISFEGKACGPMISDSETQRCWTKLMKAIKPPAELANKWKVLTEMKIEDSIIWLRCGDQETRQVAESYEDLATIRRTDGRSMKMNIENR